MPGSGRRGSSRLIITAIALAGVLPAAGALAASPAEDALRAAVEAIDASPQWRASYRDLGYDSATDTATISGVAIGPEAGRDFAVEFDRIAVAGYRGDGGFAASRIAVGTARLQSPLIGATLSGLTLEGLSVPDFSAVAIDPARPFTSIVRAYGVAALTALQRATIDRFVFTETVAGETTEVAYSDIRLEDMRQGRIRSMSTGPLTMTLPAPEGLFRFAMRRFEATDYDLNGFVEVFDPDRYAGGQGDMRWQQFLGHAAYRDVSIEAPGAVIRFGELSFDDFRLRQPPRPFTDFFDEALRNPAGTAALERMAPESSIYMMAAFGLGQLSMKDVDVASIGIDRFRLGEFYMDEVSIDGLGAIGVRNVDVAVPGEAAVRLDDFAFGDMTFAPLDQIVAAMRDGMAGREPRDPLALVPELGFVQAAGLDLALAGQLPVRLERARLDLGAYIRVIPTAMALKVEGFDLPLDVLEEVVALVSDGGVRFPTDIVRALGYSRLTMDYGFDAAWNEVEGAVQLTDLHLAIAEMGRIGIDFGLSGITRAMIANFDRPPAKAPELMFEGLKVTVTDGSLFNRVLDYAAERLNVTPAQLKATMLVTLPFQLIGVVPDAELRTQIMHAVQGFVQAPGTLTIGIEPVGEVPLTALSAISDPAELTRLFTVTVENVPAAEPPAPPEPQ